MVYLNIWSKNSTKSVLFYDVPTYSHKERAKVVKVVKVVKVARFSKVVRGEKPRLFQFSIYLLTYYTFYGIISNGRCFSIGL